METHILAMLCDLVQSTKMEEVELKIACRRSSYAGQWRRWAGPAVDDRQRCKKNSPTHPILLHATATVRKDYWFTIWFKKVVVDAVFFFITVKYLLPKINCIFAALSRKKRERMVVVLILFPMWLRIRLKTIKKVEYEKNFVVFLLILFFSCTQILLPVTKPWEKN